MHTRRVVLYILGALLGAFLVMRAVVFPFEIDVSDPRSYGDSWGGPGLLGVLLVHCGPGVVVVAAAGFIARGSLGNRPGRDRERRRSRP